MQLIIRVSYFTSLIRGAKKGNDTFLAVDNVSFELRRGTTAVVGESGSGVDRREHDPPTPRTHRRQDLLHFCKDTSTMVYELFQLRRRLQAGFQNPYDPWDSDVLGSSA